MLKDNPKYQLAFESVVHGIRLYVPTTDTDYHLSRYVAAGAQNIYSASGATKDLLSAMMDKMIDMCNNERDVKTLRTDIGVLANNIKYRLRYPIDEDCALRMGATYCFLEDEDPDTVSDVYTRKKLQYAKGDTQHNIPHDPDLYSFFLNLGQINTPSWKGLEQDLNDTDYLKNRTEALQSLMPQNTL